MKKRIGIIFVLLIVIIFSSISFVACDKKNSNVILTTIFPLTEMAQQIVGDKIEIKQLITTNDPHHYEPTTSDQKFLTDAKAIFFVDSDFEHELAEYLEKNAKLNKKAHMASKGIEKIEVEEHEHHEGKETGHDHDEDPHIWTSPKKALKMLENIKNAIVEIDPTNKEYYVGNYNRYKKELEKVDKEYEDAAALIEQKEIYLTHGAFTYLSDYGFIQESLTVGHEEASNQEFAEFVDELLNKNVQRLFYVDKEGKEKDIAERLIKEVKNKNASSNIKAYYIDRLVLKDKYSLIEVYKYNLSAIKG